jgi:hypothetical protein
MTKMLWSGQASPRRSRRSGSGKVEEKIRLKQYVSLCSKGRHKYVIYSYPSDQEAIQNNDIAWLHVTNHLYYGFPRVKQSQALGSIV